MWADGKAHYPMENLPTKACPNCDGDGRVLSGDEGHAVARAAQKKLVEWLTEHNEWRDLIKFEVSEGVAKEDFPLLSLSKEDWQALREGVK